MTEYLCAYVHELYNFYGEQSAHRNFAMQCAVAELETQRLSFEDQLDFNDETYLQNSLRIPVLFKQHVSGISMNI